MAKKELPTPQELRNLLSYDERSGTLKWLPRTPDQFADNPRGAEKICEMWNNRYAGKPALACASKRGYLTGKLGDRSVMAHRVAFALFHGRWPVAVDHINGDMADNRIENLRDVDHSQNMRNRRMSRNNQTGVVGVHWSAAHNKWLATISHSNKSHVIGRFDDKDDAILARKMLEVRVGYHKNHGRQ